MRGRLFLVGTPIGNLGDISQRAVETLRSTSHIYAEDTRRTRALLSHLAIEGKQLSSLHAHSSERALSAALEVLESGHQVALVTDAGMPGVSDPGVDLVRRARERGIEVVAIPGPSAVTAAVALSGLVDGPFAFLGFLPRKGRSRKDSLDWLARSPIPVVLFESPHRMNDTLDDLMAVCGPDRQAALCRELTKKFEETLVGSLGQFSRDHEWRGELTLVVAQATSAQQQEGPLDVDARIAELLLAGATVRDAAEVLAGDLARSGTKVRRREVYARVMAIERAQTAASDEPSDEPPISC